MSNKAQNDLRYFSQLDGLRCFAVLSVMIGHWMGWDSNNFILKNVPWGHGVILFFVLSGYLISNILFELKEKITLGEMTLGQSLKTFYIRRFLRIFPAYYILIFFLFSINYANTREVFPWLVTYTSNLLQCKSGIKMGDFTHFWSLAVEEQFYILWPCIILMVNHKYVLRVILLFMLLSVASRTWSFFAFEDWVMNAYFTPNLFFPLCLGALLAYASRYNSTWHRYFSNVYIMYGLIGIYMVFYYLSRIKFHSLFLMGVADEYLYASASVFIICRASQNKFKYLADFLINNEVTIFLGKISYGLYLYHYFVINFFWNYISPEFALHVGNKHMIWFLYFVTTLVIALVSYYVVEKPANSLKRFFKY